MQKPAPQKGQMQMSNKQDNETPKTRAVVKRIEPEQFVEALYRHNKNATRAIKELRPDLTESSATNKGHRMLTNANVAPLIDKMDRLIEQGAYKGLKRANKLINSDNEKVATANIWKLVEHHRGTAVQRQHVTSEGITLNLDLTSTLQLDE